MKQSQIELLEDRFLEFLKEKFPGYTLTSKFHSNGKNVIIKCDRGHEIIVTPTRLRSRVSKGTTSKVCNHCRSIDLFLKRVQLVEGTDKITYEVIGEYDPMGRITVKHLICGKEFSIEPRCMSETTTRNKVRCIYCGNNTR